MGHGSTRGPSGKREDGQDDGPDDHGPGNEAESHLLISAVQRPDVTQEHGDTDHDRETGAIPRESRALARQSRVGWIRQRSHWTRGSPPL